MTDPRIQGTGDERFRSLDLVVQRSANGWHDLHQSTYEEAAEQWSSIQAELAACQERKDEWGRELDHRRDLLIELRRELEEVQQALAVMME